MAAKKSYKKGDYAYMVGWGICRVVEEIPVPLEPRFDTAPARKPGDIFGNLNLSGLQGKQEPQKPAPFIFGQAQQPARRSSLKIVVIPEDRTDATAHTVMVDNDSPHLIEPFDQETLQQAIAECGKQQEPRFDTIEEVRAHALQLINSRNLVDVGRAYAYAYGHEGNLALQGILVQAIKIFISQRGYLEYVQRNREYDGNAIRRIGRTLNLHKPQGPITPLIGQEPKIEETVEIEEPAAEIAAPETPTLPLTPEQRQNETLQNYFNEVANQCTEEQYQELCFLLAIFNHERSDQLAFRHKYIILQELFGADENRDTVIQNIRTLAQSKRDRDFTAGKYKGAVQSAFKAIDNVLDVEGGMSLDVHEDASDHPEAFDRLLERIERFVPNGP